MTIFEPRAESSDDRALVLAFQRGEKDTYEEIHQRYQAKVDGICRRMLFDAGEAQEASQETFLRVYQALGRFNGRYQLGAWISRIATNVCLDQLRARGRGPSRVVQLDDLEATLAEPNSFEPEAAVIRNAESRHVRSVLRSLPPLYRAAIVLREFEGLPYSEIASALELSEAQVKALLHRARQSFKRSWLGAVASIFLPARWIQKLRGFETSSVEYLAQGSASSAPAVASCTAALQHCGQVFAEKVVPVAAALVIGATGGAVATSAAQSEQSPAPEPTVAARIIRTSDARDHDRTKPDRETRSSTDDEAATQTEIPAPEATPTMTPEPAESPDGGPAPSQGGGTEGGSPDSPQSPAAPPPFVPSIGFAGSGERTSSVHSHQFSLSCDTPSVSQQLLASFWDGDQSYLAELDLDADANGVEFELRLFPDGDRGMDVEYEGSGALTSQMVNGAVADLQFSGSFQDVDAPDAERSGLPATGTFQLRLRLDCQASVLTDEYLSLSR